MDDFIGLVNSQMEYLQGEADRYPPEHVNYSERRQKTFLDLVGKHRKLRVWLESQREKEIRLASLSSGRIGRRLGDLSRIPPELLKELAAPQRDAIETQIIAAIEEDYDGIASIDEVILGVFDRTKMVKTRKYITNKLGKLAADGVLFKGKRGFYATSPDALAKEGADEDDDSTE